MNISSRASPKSFLKLSADISSSYGFRSMRELERAAPPAERSRGTYTFATAARLCSSIVVSRALIASRARLATIPPTKVPPIEVQEPVLAYYASPTSSYTPHGFSMRETGEFGLSIVGSSESMGEVLLIKVIAAILEEWGAPISGIRINALGDRDSQQRFARELLLYFRKHAGALEAAGELKFSDNPIEAYRRSSVMCRDIIVDAPRSVNFLSEKSRAHFRNILEQLELLNLPYQLDYSLVSDEREQGVLFAIDLAGSDMIVCASAGGRYDDFMRRMTGRKESTAVHASIFFRRKGIDRSSCKTLPKTPPPKVYFVQLGARAKLQGLAVVDMLRAAHIPALQSFDSNHLGNQLAAARQSGVSHVLIMGQREVLDGTIIIRSADERAQATVTLSQLPRYLRTLRV